MTTRSVSGTPPPPSPSPSRGEGKGGGESLDGNGNHLYTPSTFLSLPTASVWVGHSTILFKIRDKTFITDPVFSRRVAILPRLKPPAITMEQIPRLDYILVSHTHFDHLDRPSIKALVAAFPQAVLILPEGAQSYLKGIKHVSENPHPHPLPFRERPWSMPRHPGRGDISWPHALRGKGESPLLGEERDRVRSSSHGSTGMRLSSRNEQSVFLKVGETFAADGVRITRVPSQHFGGRYGFDQLWKKTYGGFVVEYSGVGVYFAGDTGYNRAMFEEIGTRSKLDLALLPIGAYSPPPIRHHHMNPQDAVNAMTDLGARAMLPMHHSTFILSAEPRKEPITRLRALAAKNPSLKIFFPRFGEILPVP